MRIPVGIAAESTFTMENKRKREKVEMVTRWKQNRTQALNDAKKRSSAMVRKSHLLRIALHLYSVLHVVEGGTSAWCPGPTGVSCGFDDK